MEDLEFQTRLRYLGQDVGNIMGLMLQKEIKKCVSQLDTTGDTKQFCLKLAEILSKFSTYTQQYASNLIKQIKDVNKEEDYSQAIETLTHLRGTRKDVNGNSCKSMSVPNEDIPNGELQALSQTNSVHFDGKDAQLSQSQSIDLISHSECALSSSQTSQSTIIYSNNDPKDANDTQSQNLEDIFEEETVRNSPPNMGDIESDPEVTISTDNVINSGAKADETINANNSSPAELVENLQDAAITADYESDVTVGDLENNNLLRNTVSTLPIRERSDSNTDSSQVFELTDKAVTDADSVTKNPESSNVTDNAGPDNTMKCTDEKFQFLKCLSVAPINTADGPAFDSPSKELPISKNVSVEPASCDSDVFGDVSSSEMSAEGSPTKNKRKLKDADKKLLLKLISEFYMKRKRERESATDSSSITARHDKRVAKRTPRKKRDPENSPSGLKINKTKNMALNKDSSDDDLEVTQIADFRTSRWLKEVSTEGSVFDGSVPEQTETDEESQVVKPFKRKSVQPLFSSKSDSHSSDVEHCQVVKPFKRDVVLPLPVSQSDDNGNVEVSDSRLSAVKPDTGQKRCRTDSESSEADFDTPTQVVPSRSLQNLEPSPKRRKTESESSHAGRFEMDDVARDDLLEMLDQSHKDSGMVSDSEEFSTNQFKLGDSDRDNLLNLLTGKEREEGVADPDQSGLNNEGRDELLELLSSRGGDGPDSTNNMNVRDEKNYFQLTDSEKDELLHLLQKQLQKITYLDCVEEKMALELIEEFEEMCRNQRDLNSPDNCLTNMLDHPDSNLDSETDSVILDILKEESIDQANQSNNRSVGRPKDQSKEAWHAYRLLLQDDEDISDSSSEDSVFDIDKLDANVTSDQERRDAVLRERFDIKRELFVNVEQINVSKYDLSRLRAKRGVSSDDDDDDRLNDLTNILRKSKRPAKFRPKVKNDRSHKKSGNIGDSSETSDQENDTDGESSVFSHVTSPESPVHISDDEENERLANALFDDIKNSSDDQSENSSDFDVSSSDNESKKKEKRKSVELGERKMAKASNDNGESSHNSSDSDSSSSEIDDNSKPDQEQDTEIKRAELDSSDEEYFMGVHIERGAWRRDPLLNECLTSNDSGSDSSGRRTRKGRAKKRIRSLEAGSDCAETASHSERLKTPVKAPFDADDSDSSDFEFIEENKTPQKPIVITDEDDTPTNKGKGRRNIRALVKDDDLAEATQRANNEEKNRLKRLQERDKVKETFTQSQPYSEEEHEPLILDVHNGIEIKVHPKIVKKLKPHQREGIQFMWDSCYLSLKDLEEGYKGSGCVLAHCMGLGKTLQALALVQALFSNSATKTKHVLVVCPLSTILNWKNEYNLAYKHVKHSHIRLYTIENTKVASLRLGIVNDWRKTGGVLVLNYECFGLMSNEQKLKKWEGQTRFRKEDILEALIDPGPELIICDEGHLLRNKQSQRTLALNKVKTRRRIVLTGTPMQNNLQEYYYMVQFVKPNLLGNQSEFKTNFVNPIVNGQYEDSTTEDIMFMKKRTHCLHKILTNTVQRVEDTELKQYLPKLVDQAVFVKLSDLQVKLYNTYLNHISSRPVTFTKTGDINRQYFLADVQIFRYICLHPNVITIAEKQSKKKIKEQDVIEDNFEDVVEEKVLLKGGWCKELLSSDETVKLEAGTKMAMVVAIIKEAVANGDKVLIFSQFHAEMDCLEDFMSAHLDYRKNRDYCRMDGTSSPIMRTLMCDRFNDKNSKIKVFMMMSKVGGLGLNLTAANRIIIMNVHWNPSWDTQSVFRAFRFGQTKAVYVYRLVALDTMEEKMYQRVVTKLAAAHRVVDKHQITRHYSAADVQEFYSARPVIDKVRPVPNVPDDRILANLLQKYHFVYRWHEHQALLANRPEEDLDEQQKNAAWEEYNKKPTEPPIQGASTFLAQPGSSGLQNNPPPFKRRRRRTPKNSHPSVFYTHIITPTASVYEAEIRPVPHPTLPAINAIIPALNIAVPNLPANDEVDELNKIVTGSLNKPWTNDRASLNFPSFYHP